MSETSATASSPAASSGSDRTSGSSAYLVLWKVLLVAPSGLMSQWLSVRAPTEADALAELQRARPEWTIARDASGNPRIARERNP